MPKRATSTAFNYRQKFEQLDFRKHPEKYQVGVGEQGVLLVEPYKSEILPFWRFKTPEIAEESARKIYRLFQAYKRQDDFVGMDMARKFLQMGYTRSRRYANHPGGRKYAGKKPKDGVAKPKDGVAKRRVLPQAPDWATSPKAESARIFYGYYLKAREDPKYRRLKAAHQAREKAKVKAKAKAASGKARPRSGGGRPDRGGARGKRDHARFTRRSRGRSPEWPGGCPRLPSRRGVRWFTLST